MSDHKISANGLSIECHAAPDADCRARPDCETDFWNKGGCQSHNREHKLASAHSCWQIEWVNASSLEDSYHDPDAYPVSATPGRAVELINEVPEAMLWKYEEAPNA